MSWEPKMPTIFCKKCRRSFEPDLLTRGPWICPHCRAKNANLRRHYRSIADLFILGLIASALFLYFNVSLPLKFQLTYALVAADVVLLMVTIVTIYRSKTPWASTAVRSLIWVVFGIAFLFNCVVPLIRGRLVIPALIAYAILFPYLFWLHWRTNRSTALGPEEATGAGPIGTEPTENERG
jgi:hypothetical protein